jgi:hypothetical protein
MVGELNVSEFMGLMFGVLFVWWFIQLGLDWIAAATVETIMGLGVKDKDEEPDDTP